MEWLAADDYWLARTLFQRALAAIYVIAFVAALRQFRPLLGERGLLPVPEFLARVRFLDAPSLFHWRYSDRLLVGVTWTGIALAIAALLGLLDLVPTPVAMLAWLALWALYLSIVNVGQTFYAFGWESLLCETGFLAVFLGNAQVAPPITIVFLIRWLLFRVEFGAGLIKLRGDECWRDLTCLYYHHETQPMPNPLSWYFHDLPKGFHRFEVLGNHVAQIVAPVFLFAPQPLAAIAGLIVLATQGWLVLSGNFAWLNVVTMTLALASLDDRVLGPLFARGPAAEEPAWFGALVLVYTALILALSYRPARNLLSRRQLMNYSFDPFHVVGTYGAFGSVTKERDEVVVAGTTDAVLLATTVWREYEFKGKPGDVTARPRQYAPYHLRLDWLMWFAAMSSPMYHEWFVPFMTKLLQADRPTLALLRRDPFRGEPPRFVRALLYRYRFTTPAERRATGAWWHRELIGDYLPAVSLRRPTARGAVAR
ncbi:MAG TPA: lipase maturation factor family protein [Candidatus Limnocylindria bacterium]|nr:lipase maturation factor family protein [Candidatus Limnocylindria bacterium]